MRVLDLFSGIGGFSIGLEAAGMETIAFCEIDEYCQKVLEKNWPRIPVYEDIKELSGEQFRGSVDVICGGFPCQDISIARPGAQGIKGEKSGLWSELARLISEIRPQFAIMENVSMLLSRGLGDVLRDLSTIGYDAIWHCIPASHIGAPHQRDRIWIIAYPSSWANTHNEWTEKFSKCLEENISTYTNSNRSQKTYTLREWEFSVGGRYWNKTQPPFFGMDDGIPNWSHQTKGLGNAVVPVIPELIGKTILETI